MRRVFGETGQLNALPQSNNQIYDCTLIRRLGTIDPPAEAACPSLWQVVEAADNQNSNPRNDNSHRNMDHCSHLDNPHTRNSRNHNL